MKIAFTISSLAIGGAETMLLKLLERLDAGISPHVISLTTLGEIGPRIQALGVPVEALGMRPRLPDPLAFFRLVRRLRALNPDVVHTWMYHADLLGGLAARAAGVQAVAWGIRNTNLDSDKTKLMTRLVVWACARASNWVPDRILSCSEAARQVHVDRGYAASKMVVVPNGFDLDRFQPDVEARASIRSELGVEPDAPLVGLIGRFDAQKNHKGFFEAAGLLHRRLPKAQFVLAGSGVDCRNLELRRHAERTGVRHVTHLLGLRNDIPRLMAALDVLVSSSYGESFPNVLGEAMASGVPCAVTDVGDSSGIVADTGRIVASGDMAGLALAMEQLLTMPVQDRAALGERARARVATYFEIGEVVHRYEALYHGLVRSGRQGNIRGMP